MTAPTAQRALRLALAAALSVAGVLLLGSPAQAETKVVTLDQQGPAPQIVDVKVGDTVRFFNADNVAHTVTRTSGAWTFSATIAAGASATTRAFTTACTCGYSDTHVVVVVSQTDNGTVRVAAATPSPSPSAKPSPRPSTSPAPRPSASATPSTSPTPLPTQSGVAVGPGLDPGVLPTATPTESRVPAPDLASPTPAVAPASGPAYADPSTIVQGSPRRYGLPAALAVVAVVGVVSLLVRLLLAQPEARQLG